MIEHHIQKHILRVLYRQKEARFRDLRPGGVDTNLYSYHLKTLLKQKYIKKVEAGYTLDMAGLQYVDRVSEENMSIRLQPKIISMLLVTNSTGGVLLQRRQKQPYIDTWTLPYGKVHADDLSIQAAAVREADEKLGLEAVVPSHRGDCYIRVFYRDELLSSTLAHIFQIDNSTVNLNDDLHWADPTQLQELRLAPAVKMIISESLGSKGHFLREFNENWLDH